MWNLIFFKENDNCYAIEFILLQKDPAVRVQLEAALDRLEIEGNRLEFPQVRPLGNGLYELREHRKKVQYRFYYFFDKNEIIVTHGWISNHKKENEQIKFAQRCRNSHLGRKE